MLEWEIVMPDFEGLYEALPVWVWAKQKTGKRKTTKAAAKGFILISYFSTLIKPKA
jgi:hypothetical protein